MPLNTAIISGNITRTPEVRYTPSGDAVCDLTVAVNEVVKGEKRVSFIDCTVWGKTAEACGKHLDKGDTVAVEGKLRQDTWENKDGQKRSKIKITAFHVEFLRVSGWGRSGGAAGESQETGFDPADEDQSGGPPWRDALPDPDAEDQENLPF